MTGAGILAAMSKRAVALKAARELASSRPAQALRARLPRGLRPGSGGGGVCCPLCGTRARRFLPFGGGNVVRPNARCAHCDSLERHRLIWLYLRNETDLFSPTGRKRMLHVAPEPVLRERLIGEPLIDYLSADLEPGAADVQMDITAIDFPADSFDVIYCSHVLEHVPDDALAMRELCRVLRPTGWAILQVPILLARTDEDPSITDPEERLRRFAQRDHVRAYGPDYADRLRAAGFTVRLDRYAERLGPESARRHGVLAQEIVHFCTKG